jgi:hypothetical protein
MFSTALQCVLLLLAAPEAAPPPDELIPLTLPSAPTPTPAPADRSAKVQNATPIAHTQGPSLLLLGAHVGVGMGTRGPQQVGLDATLELGGSLPFAERAFAISGWLGFNFGSGQFRSSVGRFSTTIVGGSFAAVASFNPKLGPGKFRLMAGPQFVLNSVTAKLNSSQSEDLGVGLGLLARVAYLFSLSSTQHLGAEVGYQLRPYAVIGVSGTDHMLVAAVSYLFNSGERQRVSEAKRSEAKRSQASLLS